MGEQNVKVVKSKRQMKKFVEALLNDVEALSYMLENDWFEDDIVRIGAEQEMCIVDSNTYKPKPISMQAIEMMGEPEWLETELAQFNIETNLTPRIFEGSSLSDMERENSTNLNKLIEGLKKLDAIPMLTGVLPTLRKYYLSMDYLTPKVRYKALMDALNAQLMRQSYELRLSGIDELILKHDSPLLEACNTSFQVHLQVNPQNFVKMYNISQLLLAPILAISANSPLVFGRRLWHESRIALFQQSLDTRSSHDHMRERSPRVSFGNSWIDDSILEIYKEDIARFRVLLSAETKENSVEALQKGEVPSLKALQVHNSTVYRWNRGCYGVSDTGKPHLRIENRILPSGPTIIDEFSNAALWLGAMIAYKNELDDVRKLLSFSAVSDNFGKAARYGMETKMRWFNGKKYATSELLLNEIIPMAREGLKSRNIDQADIDRYLGTIEERTKVNQNGAIWILDSFSKLIKTVPRDEANAILTASMIKKQEAGIPVHKWKLSSIDDLERYQASLLKVEEFMETDLISAHKDDVVELIAEMMDWNLIRYLPVENKSGELIGLVTGRLLLRHYLKTHKTRSRKSFYVKDIMIDEPITIRPDDTIMDAMNVMRKNNIGCLPVTIDKELVGMITEKNFMMVSGRLIERLDLEYRQKFSADKGEVE